MNVNNNKRAVQQQPAATTAAGGSSSGGGAGAPLNAVEHNHHQVVTVTAATPNSGSDRSVELQYADTKVIGNGSFGVVYLAKLVQTNEDVAIKKVLQDKRFKNRELQIMRRLDHRNVVKLKYFFYTNGEKKDEVYLNLILEYVPETVYRVARHYAKQRQIIPILYIKIYMYQLFRALAYIHSIGICHRDIKPQNLLLNAQTSVLKLCDFGSAKILTPGEPNVAYICSRYYRAPELIFGATDYTTKIDVWSAGTVLAELLLGQPFFPGDSGVDQLVEIIKVLGTPTREEIQMMNPNYTEFRFPMIRPHPWQRVFRARTPQEAVDLVSQLLRYTPTARLSPLEAMAHEFFDELRSPSCKLPSANPMPVLFDFSDHELSIEPHLNGKLIPPHLQPLRCCPTTSGGGLEANTQSAKSTTSTTETSDAQESGSRNEPTSATAAAASSSVSNANNVSESVKQSGTTPTNATSAPNVSASGTTTGCGGGSTGSSSAAPGGGGAPAASSGGASTAAVAAGGSDKDH